MLRYSPFVFVGRNVYLPLVWKQVWLCVVQWHCGNLRESHQAMEDKGNQVHVTFRGKN